VVGVSAVLTALNAFTTELFPTELRGNAFAWSNNLIGRIGYCVSPVVIGQIAETTGWGLPLRVTAIFPIVALLLILWLLPETRARELEETAVV
jgi:putative MFS transporter